MRKILVGLISLAAVIGVFLLYSRIGRTPPLESGTRTGAGGVADSNFGRFGDVNQIRKIGDFGVGTSEKAYFATRNDSGEIIAEFGYEVLIHEQDGLLKLKKPYRNIYQSGFTCYMTADAGTVEVEDTTAGISPKDAAFNGNVLIRIIPGSDGDFKETKIYLDDLVFLSDRSQLATGGPVTVISEDIRMVGTGMELIYNDVLSRLELFRIFDLESLLIKQPKTAQEEPEPADPMTQTKTEVLTKEPVEVAVTADVKEPEPEPEPEPEQNQYYKCVFSRNVFIDTQEELIYAAREVFINDILWSKSPDEEAPAKSTPSESDANEPDLVVAQDIESNEPVFTVADSNGPNEPPEQFVEITVTCDSGFMIVPREMAIDLEEISPSAPEAESDVLAKMFEQTAERTVLKTQRIDYSMPNDDTLATGPTELTFYAKDSNATDPNLQMIPVRVTAQRQARFLTATNQAVFEGDCFCTMPQKELTEEKDLTLSAPKLAITLPEKISGQTSKLPDMVTTGPTELVFYVEDTNAVEPETSIVPVKITAQKQTRFLSATDQVIFEGDCLCRMGSKDISRDRYFQIKSPVLTVNLPPDKTDQSFALTDIVAAGPAELDFYVDDITGAQGPNEPLPAKVIAQKQARFVSSTKQVIFEGPCRTTIPKEDPNFIEEFTLLSEKMIVDLPKDTNDKASPSLGGIQHLTAKGGVVKLMAIKKAIAKSNTVPRLESEAIMSSIEITCTRIDYDSNLEMFLATGPATVVVSNSQVTDPNQRHNGLSPGKQWWAIVRDCNNIKYLPKENRIIADVESDKILNIDYTTFEDGQYGPVVLAAAGHADIALRETPEGKTELSTLVASRGVSYKTDKGDLFIGSDLFYDHEKSLITVTGDEIQPCYYNGSLVDQIKYNVETREIEAKIVGPGVMKINKK